MSFSSIPLKKIENTREAACLFLYQLNEKKEEFSLNTALEKQSLIFNAQELAQVLAYFYGTLGHLPALDYWISKYSSLSLEKIHPFVLSALRLGTWQLAYGHQRKEASVDEIVKIVKKYMHQGAVSFTNAMLRKLSNEAFELPKKRLDLKYGLPSYLLGYIKKNVNSEDLEAYLQHLQKEMPLFINYCGEEAERVAFEQSLIANKVEFERVSDLEIYAHTPFSVLKDAYVLHLNKKSLKSLGAFRKGLFYVQGLSSQLTTEVLDIEAGQSLWDVCAAPGGKTLSLMKRFYKSASEPTESLTHFYLSDISEKRLALVRENFERLAFLNTDKAKQILEYIPLLADASEELSEVETLFDVVLCDVPCSCLGLLRSKLELRFNMTHEKIQALLPLQAEILKNASKKVKPSGYLLYSTCTINQQENDKQIEQFLASKEGEAFERVDLSERLPYLEKGSYQLTLDFPRFESEGFFLCLLRKKCPL